MVHKSKKDRISLRSRTNSLLQAISNVVKSIPFKFQEETWIPNKVFYKTLAILRIAEIGMEGVTHKQRVVYIDGSKTASGGTRGGGNGAKALPLPSFWFRERSVDLDGSDK